MKKMIKGMAPVAVLSLAAVFTACESDTGSNAPLPVENNPQPASSVTVLPESSQSVLPGSSSEEIASSSSSTGVTPVSSSSLQGVLRVPAGGLFSWNGAEDGERVITGLDAGTNNSGYWYSYADNADGGESVITWPVEVIDGDLKPVVEECQGLCGSFSLNKGSVTYNPFVGVAFNIAGTEDNSGAQYTADASAWGGVCVAYSSTVDMALLMGLGDAGDADIGYDNPSATLEKSETGTVKCIKWSSFYAAHQPGQEHPALKYAKKLAALKFMIQAKDKTQGSFNIMSVGSYVEQSSSETSSSSVQSSSSSSIAVFEGSGGTYMAWNGTKKEYRIITGLDDGANNSGYWYSYTDNGDGGKSRIVWPVELGNAVSDEAIDPVIDHCGGLCGTYELDKGSLTYKPFVGVGFNVAGEDYDTGALHITDATAWGGICVGYSSDNDIILEMSYGDADESQIPYTILPKSAEGVEKCVTWNQLVRAGWGCLSDCYSHPEKIAALRFNFQAATGTKGKFNIFYIASYN